METEASLVTQKIPSVFYNISLCSFSRQAAKRLNCFTTQRKGEVQTLPSYPCPGESVQMLQQKKMATVVRREDNRNMTVIFPTTAPCSLCCNTCDQDQLHKGCWSTYCCSWAVKT